MLDVIPAKQIFDIMLQKYHFGKSMKQFSFSSTAASPWGQGYIAGNPEDTFVKYGAVWQQSVEKGSSLVWTWELLQLLAWRPGITPRQHIFSGVSIVCAFVTEPMNSTASVCIWCLHSRKMMKLFHGRVAGMIKRLAKKSLCERLQKLYLFSLTRRRLKGNLITACK